MTQQYPTVKVVWRISYPLIISMMSYTIMQFSNRVFLAWYSSDALAACVPAGLISFTFICFFMGVCIYTNVFVAQFYGSKKYAKLTVALWQGVWVGVISLLVIAAFVPLGLYFINSSNHTDAVKILERKYFTIVTLFGGFAPISYALASFFTGQGKTKITMLVNALGNLFNILINYLFIFGVGFFPELGITGAAIGFVSGHAVIITTFLLIIFSKKNKKVFRTARLLTFYPKLFFRILKYGVPSGVGFFIDISSFTVFVFLAGNMGKISLASINIILSIQLIAFMPVLGLGMGILTLVGQYVGRKRHDLAIKAFYNGLKLSGCYVAVLSFLFLVFPSIFVKIFGIGNSPDLPAILELTYKLMKILPIFIVVDSFQIMFANAIKGAGDTKFQMLTALACAWGLFVPGVYILSKNTDKIEYIFLWACLYLTCMAVTFIIRFKSNRWQKIDITKK